MIDRYLLRYFLAVIDQGNFSKAAAFCNVSQPTLSAGIAKLETDLGRPLFFRNNRRVEITEAGVQLASRARRIEAEFVAAERDATRIAAPSTLRLGVLSSIPGIWIADYVARLHDEGIRERIELVEGRERELIDRLSVGRIDAALTILKEDGRFNGTRLFSEGYSLAMAAHHPLAGRNVIDGAELAGEAMLIRRNCELLSDTSRYFTARGVRPFFPARVNNDDQALRLVRAGLGITVMPDCFREQGVVRPALAEFPFTRDVGLLFADHIHIDTVRSRRSITVLEQTIEACTDRTKI